MTRLFRFSPYRLALVYILLSVLVLGVFAIPLWYVWRVNYSTLRTYVDAQAMHGMLDIFEREGAKGLAAAIDSRVGTVRGDEIMFLADPSKERVAGNLPAAPSQVPDVPGTSGLVIDPGGSSLRVVVSHLQLPGGYHFLMGRESVRFQSLVDLFWYGIAGAAGTVLVLGAVVGWMIRRALLSEVHDISRTASAIVEGDFSRRGAVRGGSDELDALARTVNGMLEQLVAYAYAAQFPQAMERLVLMDAFLPGIGNWKDGWLLRDLWHFHFYGDVPLALVQGRERIYFEHFGNDFAADPTHSVSEADRRIYAEAYAQPGGMRAGFEYFRAFERDAQDFADMAKTRLAMPVLVLTGEKASGNFLIDQAGQVAMDVHGEVLKGAGHWLMEEAPAAVLPAITRSSRKRIHEESEEEADMAQASTRPKLSEKGLRIPSFRPGLVPDDGPR